jgi:hypothetical protein
LFGVEEDFVGAALGVVVFAVAALAGLDSACALFEVAGAAVAAGLLGVSVAAGVESCC